MNTMNKKTCFVAYHLLDGVEATRFNGGFKQSAEDLAWDLARYADKVIIENTEGIFYAVADAAHAYISEGVDWVAVAYVVLNNTDESEYKEPEPWDESEGECYDSGRPEYAQPYMSRW